MEEKKKKKNKIDKNLVQTKTLPSDCHFMKFLIPKI